MNRLEDLREWLTAKIDGSEETRGEDSLISHFINQIDALPSSEMGTIPSDPAATPVTDAVVKMMEAGWLSLGSSAPGAVKPLVEALEVFERENADLKQRLLPQYLGRAERAEKARQMAEHERDSVVEELIALRSAPSATAATQDAQAIVAACCVIFDCRPSELLGMILGLKGTAPPVEGKQMNNEDLLTELRWALDNIGASRDYFRIGNALESAIKALSATGEPDRPDWAQQLPGAEIFDRAARYEYLRTLNPRKFAALYNEALMGVHQFDDLVDRYRDAGEKQE